MQGLQNNQSIPRTNFLLIFLLNSKLLSTANRTFIDDPNGNPNHTLAYNLLQPNQNLNCNHINISILDSASPETTETEHSRRMKRCIALRLREKVGSRKSSPKSESNIMRLNNDGSISEADEETVSERGRRDDRSNAYQHREFDIGSHLTTNVHDNPVRMMEKLRDILEDDTRSSAFNNEERVGSGDVSATVTTHAGKEDHLQQSLLQEENSLLGSLRRSDSYNGTVLENDSTRVEKKTRQSEQMRSTEKGHLVPSPLEVHSKVGKNDGLQFEINDVKKELNADNQTHSVGLLPQSELSMELNVPLANTGSSWHSGSSQVSEPSFQHENHRQHPHRNSYSQGHTDHHRTHVSSESYPRVSEIPPESGVSLMKPSNELIIEPSGASPEKLETPAMSSSYTDRHTHSETLSEPGNRELREKSEASSETSHYFYNTSEKVYDPSLGDNSVNHILFQLEESTSQDQQHLRTATDRLYHSTTESAETISVKPPQHDSHHYNVASEKSIHTTRKHYETSKGPLRSEIVSGKVSSNNSNHHDLQSPRISSGKSTSHDFQRSDSSLEELHHFTPEDWKTPLVKLQHHPVPNSAAASGKLNHAERKSSEAASPAMIHYPREKFETSSEPDHRDSSNSNHSDLQSSRISLGKSTSHDFQRSDTSSEGFHQFTPEHTEAQSVKLELHALSNSAVASGESSHAERESSEAASPTMIHFPREKFKTSSEPDHRDSSNSNHSDLQSSRISLGKATSYDDQRSDTSSEGLHHFIPEDWEMPSVKRKHHPDSNSETASGTSNHAERKPSESVSPAMVHFPRRKLETSSEPNRRGRQHFAVTSDNPSETNTEPTEAIYLPQEKLDVSPETFSSGNSNHSDFHSQYASGGSYRFTPESSEASTGEHSRRGVALEKSDASSETDERFQVAAGKSDHNDLEPETPSKLLSNQNNEKSSEGSSGNFGHTEESARKQDSSYKNSGFLSNAQNHPIETFSGNATHPDTGSSPDSSGKLTNSKYPHSKSSSARSHHLARDDLEETHSYSKKPTSESPSRSDHGPLHNSASDFSNKTNASSVDSKATASGKEIHWDSGYAQDQFQQKVLVSSTETPVNSDDQIGSSLTIQPSPNEVTGYFGQHEERVSPKPYPHQKIKLLSESFANFCDTSDAKRKPDKAPLKHSVHVKTGVSSDIESSSVNSSPGDVHQAIEGSSIEEEVASKGTDLEKETQHSNRLHSTSWVRNTEPMDLDDLRSAAKAKELISHGNDRQATEGGDLYEDFLQRLNEVDKKRMKPFIHLLRGNRDPHWKRAGSSHKFKAPPGVDSEHHHKHQLKPLEEASSSVDLSLNKIPVEPPLKSSTLGGKFQSSRNETNRTNSNSVPVNKTDEKVNVTIGLTAEDPARSRDHDILSVEEVRPLARNLSVADPEDEFPIDVPRKLDYLLENKDAALELKMPPLRINVTSAKRDECNKIYIIADKSSDILNLLKLAGNSNQRDDPENPIVSGSRPTSSPFDINDMIRCVNVKTGSNNFASTDNLKVRESVVQLLDMLKERRAQEYELGGHEETGGRKHETIMQINEYIELLELLLVYLSRDPYELLDKHNDARQSNNESPFPYEDPHRRFIEDQFYYVNPKILNEFIDVYKRYSTRDSFPAYKKGQGGHSSKRRKNRRPIGGSISRLLRLQSLIPPLLHDRMHRN